MRIPQAIVHYNLALVIRLVDSVTSRLINRRDVKIRLSRGIAPPVQKATGEFLFMNAPKEDFDIAVDVYGYELNSVSVNFETLDERLPILEVYMVPKESADMNVSYMGISGKLDGITAIEAISLREAICNVKEYETRKKELTVFNPKNVPLSRVHYALLNEQEMLYDRLEAEKELTKSKLVLKAAPEHGCKTGQPVYALLRGQTDRDGNYLLRAYESRNSDYLVRYEVNGQVYFQRMDFLQPQQLGTGGSQWASQ